MPEMNYVDSSNVEAIGHDEATLDLYVQFLGGSTYVYHNVPREVFDNFMDASSKGSFLNREIKNIYQFTKQ